MNVAPILLGIIFCMVGGFAWYGAFSKPWMRSLGITRNDVDESGLSLPKAISASIFCSAILSVSLELLTSRLEINTFTGGAALGAFAWLAFNFTTTFKFIFWEDRPWTLFWINSGYDVISCAVVGGIVATW